MAGMGRPKQMGVRPKVKKGTMKRLLKMLFSEYRWQMLIIALCLIVSAIGGSLSSIFLQKIIDEVVLPGLQSSFSAVSAKLLEIVITLGSVYILAILSTLVYTQIGAKVCQGFLCSTREKCLRRWKNCLLVILILMHMAI